MRRKVKGRRLGKAVRIKSKRDIEQLKRSGQLVADCFALLKASIQPGVSLRELDKKVEMLIRDHGAEPLYKGYRGNPPEHPPFPGVICASLNNEICHGLPDMRRLRSGDIIGIDIGLKKDGWCGDACVTFPVGNISPLAQRLLRVTEEAMYEGIKAARVGRPVGEIGVAIENYARRHGYSVVKQWGGHGLGRDLHEAPSIPHVGPGNELPRIRPGMVFTVEPMVNIGSKECYLSDDGWTVFTSDGTLSAQFEHTIAVTRNGAEILSPWHETMGRVLETA